MPKHYVHRHNAKAPNRQSTGVDLPVTSYPPTETVQDDAMSIRDLMERYNNESQQDKESYYFGS